MLIENRADVKVRSASNNTLLHDAASSQDPDLVQLYLDNELDVNATTEEFNRTPLHEAVKTNNNPEVIELLLKNGANPLAEDNRTRTPVHQSLKYNANPEISELLIAAVPDINNTQLLHYAASNSPHSETIEMFVTAGANMNAADSDGNTPLHCAIKSNKNPKIIEELIRNGANVKAVNNQGDTPLHVLAKNSKNLSKDNVRSATMALLKKGAIEDARNAEGKTPSEISPTIKEFIEEYSNSQKEEEELDILNDEWEIIELVKYKNMGTPLNKGKKNLDSQHTHKSNEGKQVKKNTHKPQTTSTSFK